LISTEPTSLIEKQTNKYIYLFNIESTVPTVNNDSKIFMVSTTDFEKNPLLKYHPSAEDNRNIPKIRSKDAFSHINIFKTKIFLKLENHPTHMVTNSSETEG
jgi:hypothetical protein